MHPQGQDTPQPTPNPTPTPAPQDTPPPAPQTPPVAPPAFNPQASVPPADPATPTPPVAGPSFSSPQHGGTPPVTAQTKKPPFALIAGIVGAVLLIAGGVWAYLAFFAGIALETYDGNDYTVKVPVGYVKEEQGDGMVWEEKDSKASASSVFAYYTEFPTKPTASQLSAAKKEFKSQLENKISDYTTSTHTLTDVKIEDVKYKGEDAFQATAKAKSEGREGIFKMIAVVNTEKIFIIGVAADGGDTGLIVKANEIIDSFTIK